MIDNIPEQILNLQHFPDDVSILIGENGSGKSTLLNNLSKHFLSKAKNVIAIANSIHDKFDAQHRRFRTLRGRSGRKQSRMAVKNALKNVAETDIQRIINASRALGYVEFDPIIGFKFIGLNYTHRSLSSFSRRLSFSDESPEEKERIERLFDMAMNRADSSGIIWLDIQGFGIEQLEQTSLIDLFVLETKLRELKLIERIEVFLRRDDKVISMLDASSGELVLITSIIYLSTAITENTVILIDEPENSLHPKWQKEYVKILLDIFYFYQPKIIIATHSPLIINGAELFIDDPKVYKAENFTFTLQKKESVNVEEIYFRLFDVTTPQNRFLSDRIVRYLNALANGKINLQEFTEVIDKIKESSYDKSQINVLDSVISLASEISSQNNI